VQSSVLFSHMAIVFLHLGSTIISGFYFSCIDSTHATAILKYFFDCDYLPQLDAQNKTARFLKQKFLLATIATRHGYHPVPQQQYIPRCLRCFLI
jgi:hypothetical protein